MTALVAMERAYKQIKADGGYFSFSLQYFGERLGYFVQMINGNYDCFPAPGGAVAQPFFFWDFLIDDNSAPVGVSHQIVSAGQRIAFRFERYDQKKHAGTLLETKFRHVTST